MAGNDSAKLCANSAASALKKDFRAGAACLVRCLLLLLSEISRVHAWPSQRTSQFQRHKPRFPAV